MRVNLDHPKGTVRNRITIELNDNDLEHLKHMPENEVIMYTLGYAALVVLKREKEEEDG